MLHACLAMVTSVTDPELIPRQSRGYISLARGCAAQRTFAIWSFALQFVVKYWLLGKKFTYGKAVSFHPWAAIHISITSRLWPVMCTLPGHISIGTFLRRLMAYQSLFSDS